MSGKSNIEWTQITWNPSTGCNKISEGCKYCYAESWAKMQQKRGILQYVNGFEFQIAPNRLNDPLKWKTSKLVFVNSMSDLFHENMPNDYLLKLFEVMNATPQHTYQILTKRIENAIRISKLFNWSDNIWLGVTVENTAHKNRIDLLRQIPAKLKFVSFEPLLENIIPLNLVDINWVIVGGESGANARPIRKKWAVAIKSECEKTNTPFFFKQWGKTEFNPDRNDPTIKKDNPNYSRGGCLIDKRIFREFP